MDRATEDQLISAAAARDGHAFDALMRANQEAVYRCAYAFCGSREEALDTTQTVFLKALKSIGSFQRLSSFRTWLLRIATNELLNDSRRRSRRGAIVPIDGIDLGDAAPDPERELISKDQLARLRSLLDRLGPTQRMVILLRHFEGCSLDEIAVILGSSRDVVKNALYRAHLNLHALWKETPHESRMR